MSRGHGFWIINEPIPLGAKVHPPRRPLTGGLSAIYGVLMRNQAASWQYCNFPHGVRSLACVAIGSIILTFGIPRAASQPAPEIDASSIRIEAGTLFTFQFQGVGQTANAFAIEIASEFSANSSWNQATGAVIVAVADGLFRVTLAMPGDHLFCRVRALEVGLPGPPLLINEVMSDNVSAFSDTEGQFWDWIEIYNPNDEAVNLDQYALTDDGANLAKWRFPSLFIQPYAHLLIYASDLNRTNPAAALHTNFKLKASGETLILSDAALHPLDQFQIPALAADQSVGRLPDGGAELHLYAKTNATPGSENLFVSSGAALRPPVFNPDGGFFSEPVTVQVLGAESNHVIHYTLDGLSPTALSPILTTNLTLSKSTVLRVIAVDPQGQPSAPEARSFFIGVNHGLPIVSLATAPENLAFRDGYLYGMGTNVLSSQNQVLQNYPYSGSYAWKDREVEIAMEFFETNRSLGFRQRAGMKIFGGWGSRAYPQKSLALFARKSYGAGKFNYPVFPDQNVNEFEALILRNAGNDNQSTHQTPPRPPITAFGPTLAYGSYFVNGTFTLMRDAMLQRLLRETDLDTQAYRPAVVYINGEYWGLYNLREKITEDYMISHHDLAPGSVDLIEGYGTVNAGTGTVYNQMRNYIANQNMAVTTNYAFVTENYLEIDNFIDYHLAVIYFQNFDIGNIKCWRPRAPRGRFHWVVYDQDYGFGLWPASVYVPAMARDYADYDNMFRFYTAGTGTSSSWPNGGAQTLLLRNLLKNAQFKEQFIRRCADLLNSNFREDKVEQTIAEMAAVIRPEIASHLQRWSWSELTQRGFGVPHKAESQPFTQATWETNLTVLANFGRDRPAKLRQDCLQHFQLTGGLGGLAVQVQPEGSGRVQVNTLTVDQFPWHGIYFADITNHLRPIPNPGFRFVEWLTPTGNTNRHSFSYKVPRDQTNTLIARIELAATNPPSPSELIITEIQYHPAADQDSGDWLELYHPGTTPLNLSGWILRDEEDLHAFLLPDLILPPGATLVLCQDDSKFRLFHPANVISVGNFRFGLGNGGDSLRLFRPDGTLALAIVYDNVAPWPTAAAGGGATLQLINPQSDPNLPGSWQPSPEVGGAPGQL